MGENVHWVFDRWNNKPVKAVERYELWNTTNCLVYDPTSGRIYTLPADGVGDINEGYVYDEHRIRYILAGAKLKELIARQSILSPIGSNIIPLPHQIYALVRAISSNRIRFLLADEVGLGKTIEAGLIMTEMEMRGLVKRVLIVTPSSLTLQWKEEMRLKFNEDFHIVRSEDLTSLKHIYNDSNIWTEFDKVICSMDAIKPIKRRQGWTQEEIDEYNRLRFNDLIEAGWDMVIVDEAHRLGGSSEAVARHDLGEGLANSATHLLLLTATPHQGKSEPFWRVMKLLDSEAFPNAKALTKEQVSPYVIRTEKRKAIDGSGALLFKKRETFMREIAWGPRHEEQSNLYKEVTKYASEGYCIAKKEKKVFLGFLMTLMQRMVTSSTRAIRVSLEKRLSVLKDEASNQAGLNEEELIDMDAQEVLDNVISIGSYNTKKEIKELERLINLAKQAERQFIDVKLEWLVEEINSLKLRFGNDEKILIFTEFVATQGYICDYLMSHGHKVALINGKMGINERISSLEDFAGDCDILISTDAGGEGLNLQFCHIVINYDMPWNPMKIEQRIGRVDRIGQTRDVIAINLMIQDTVECRVRKILEDKLRVIMEEFGVDKMSDILDSALSEEEAMEMVMNSVMSPEDIEYYVDRYIENVKSRSKYIKEFNDILSDEKELSIDILKNIKYGEIYELLRTMFINYVLYNGGTVKEGKNGFDITIDGVRRYKGVTFDPSGNGANAITLNHEYVKKMIQELPVYPEGQAVPKIKIDGLANEEGYWSLWQITLNDSPNDVKIFPFFINNEGKMRLPSAEAIWDRLVSTDAHITYDGMKEIEDGVYGELYKRVSEYASSMFYEIRDAYIKNRDEERKRMEYAFTLKKEMIGRVGLETVKRHRLNELEKEKKAWEDKFAKSRNIIPSLYPLCILYME
ncbi:helicase-related protein [Calorimonas adulescens]|jgi:Helicase conserved C-terminal domain./SNF2 family N-terminal domain.|nr:helicase-related protein [Calorimonas adulescens]